MNELVNKENQGEIILTYRAGQCVLLNQKHEPHPKRSIERRTSVECLVPEIGILVKI